MNPNPRSNSNRSQTDVKAVEDMETSSADVLIGHHRHRMRTKMEMGMVHIPENLSCHTRARCIHTHSGNSSTARYPCCYCRRSYPSRSQVARTSNALLLERAWSSNRIEARFRLMYKMKSRGKHPGWMALVPPDKSRFQKVNTEGEDSTACHLVGR